MLYLPAVLNDELQVTISKQQEEAEAYAADLDARFPTPAPIARRASGTETTKSHDQNKEDEIMGSPHDEDSEEEGASEKNAMDGADIVQVPIENAQEENGSHAHDPSN